MSPPAICGERHRLSAPGPQCRRCGSSGRRDRRRVLISLRNQPPICVPVSAGKPITRASCRLVAEFPMPRALIPQEFCLARVEAERHRCVDRRRSDPLPHRDTRRVHAYDGRVVVASSALRVRQATRRPPAPRSGTFVGHFGDVFRHFDRTTIGGVEQTREARRHAPLHLGRRLGDDGRGDGGPAAPAAEPSRRITTLHAVSPWVGTYTGFPSQQACPGVFRVTGGALTGRFNTEFSLRENATKA